MSNYDRVTLELPPCDVDGDGEDETGVFEIYAGDVTISLTTRTGYLLESGATASTINSILTDWYESTTGEQASSDGKRQNFYLDLGGGAHVLELDFKAGYTGAVDDDGTPLQWGATGDPSQVTAADATGGGPVQAAMILDRYFQIAEIDSRPGHQITVHVGEYSDNGVYDPLSCVIEQPTLTFDVEDQPSVFAGSITLIEAASLDNPFDAQERSKKGSS